MRKHASNANVRNYVIYDFEGKAPWSLYCLREQLESGGLAEWIQYSIVETERLDIVLQIACFCAERGGKVEIIRGRKYAVK